MNGIEVHVAAGPAHGVATPAARAGIDAADADEVAQVGLGVESGFLAATPTEWRPLMVVALKTGLRMGELLVLKWEDVDLVVGRLVVRRSLWREIEGPPKSGRTRGVPLSDEAIATLKAQRATTLLKGPYMFAEAEGRRLKHKSLYEVVLRICKKAGLAKRLTFHDLRHTFASHLVLRGVAL